jgi:hypothetical protein
MAQELVTLSYTHPSGEPTWAGTILCTLSFRSYDIVLVAQALEGCKRVLSSFAAQSSQLSAALIDPGAVLERVATLEIPSEVEFRFDEPIGIESLGELPLPDVIIDATVEGVYVTIPAAWKVIINQGEDAWKQSREYKILLCGLCLFYKMLFL